MSEKVYNSFGKGKGGEKKGMCSFKMIEILTSL
jgi:hypothetical protein